MALVRPCKHGGMDMQPTNIVTNESELEAQVCKAALQHEALEFLHVQTERSKLRLKEQQDALAAAEAVRARRGMFAYCCATVVLITWAIQWL